MTWDHAHVYKALIARGCWTTQGKKRSNGKAYVNHYVHLYEQEPNCAVLYAPGIKSWQFGKLPLHLNDTVESWKPDVYQLLKPAIEERGRSQVKWSLCKVLDWGLLAAGLNLPAQGS